MHNGSYETYKNIMSNFIEWNRMGIIYFLADMALTHSKGDILEIGAGESSLYLNKLSLEHNRRAVFCDVQYGIFVNAFTVPDYFREDRIMFMEGDFPIPEIKNSLCVVYGGSSDSLFKKVKFEKIAFAFIDGDHHYKQVKKDFENILPFLDEKGIIALHDTRPIDDEFASEHRCGDVYKLRQELEKREDLNTFTFVGPAMGVGLTIIRKKGENLKEYQK